MALVVLLVFVYAVHSKHNFSSTTKSGKKNSNKIRLQWNELKSN